MKKYKKGGKKFPDLNGDGKVTFADVLKGRGVKKAGKGMKYKNGGKVKGLLKGLEAMPSKKGGAAKKKLPKNMSEMPGYDFQGTSKLFKENLRKIGSQANKAMEKATGLKSGRR